MVILAFEVDFLDQNLSLSSSEKSEERAPRNGSSPFHQDFADHLDNLNFYDRQKTDDLKELERFRINTITFDLNETPNRILSKQKHIFREELSESTYRNTNSDLESGMPSTRREKKREDTQLIRSQEDIQFYENKCIMERNMVVSILVNPTASSIADELSKFETFEIKQNVDSMIIEKFN